MTHYIGNCLHVIASSQAPKLELADNQCIVQGDSTVLSVGDQLFVPYLNVTLTIQSITWLMGKLHIVDQTEQGHRYVVTFDCGAIPNNLTASYDFSKA